MPWKGYAKCCKYKMRSILIPQKQISSMLADEPTGTLVYKSVATQNTVKKQKIVPPGAISFKTALDAFLFFFFFFFTSLPLLPFQLQSFPLLPAQSRFLSRTEFQFWILFTFLLFQVIAALSLLPSVFSLRGIFLALTPIQPSFK